jgi:voltage-gated potassium channel
MLQRRVLIAVGVIVLAISLGVAGYMVVEGWNFLDSLWMVAITLTTTGYGEVHTLTPAGRVFTMALLLVGMSIVVYGLSILTEFVAEGGLGEVWGRWMMKRTVAKMKYHTIVCGAGRTGTHVLGELAKTKSPYIVVEGKPEVAAKLRGQGHLVIEGDATHEECLREAGIERAARLVACLTNDQDNLFVVLTARGLNPGLRIVARYVEDHSADKLRKAGANSVVSPNFIGGMRMASEALRPAVVTFLDVMLRSGKGTFRVEEAEVNEGSKLAGKSLKDARIPDATGLLVVAIREKSGEYRFNPPASTSLVPGQVVVVMGEMDGVRKLKLLAGEKV